MCPNPTPATKKGLRRAPKNAANRLFLSSFLGAGEAIRTPDPDLGKVVLYP